MRGYAYLSRRVLSLLPVWFAISLLAFGLGALAPGDPAQSLYIQVYGVPPTDQAVLDKLREEFGLSDPFPIRYLRWISAALQGDLGLSYRGNLPVWSELATRLWATLKLAIGGMVVAGLIAFPLGILAAVRHNSLVDLLARLFSLLGAATPSYWLAYMFILLFAVHLHWLPVAGSSSWRHLLLPSLTLGLGGAALLSRLLRSGMLEVLGYDYIRTARAKGLSERKVILRHALRNALIPVVTVMGTLLGHLLSGAIITETVFAWPGIGRLIVDSISFRDYPVIQGFVLFTGTVFVLVNLMVDLSYTLIDPRVRLKGEEGRSA
jgi:ABC-type dipeptide/oligopeptide/nickel transport system permease component